MRIVGPGMSWDILDFGWIGGEFDILLGKQQEYETKYAGCWMCWKTLEGFLMAFPFISQEPELLHRVGRQNLLLQIPLPGQVVVMIATYCYVLLRIATACPMIFRCHAEIMLIHAAFWAFLCTDLIA